MREATGARNRRCGCKVVNECLSHDQEVEGLVCTVHHAFHSFTPFPIVLPFTDTSSFTSPFYILFISHASSHS